MIPTKKTSVLTVALMIVGGAVVILAAIFLLLLETGVGTRITSAANNHKPIVIIKDREIKVEIASTFKQQYRGLSGRESLCADCGMLFNFSEPEVQSFVMRDMKFPLDLIFIDQGVVKNIAAGLEPEGGKPEHIYQSTGPADQVLEVNGGYCAQFGIRPGDQVFWQE